MVIFSIKRNQPLLVGACALSLGMAALSARVSLWPIRAYYADHPVNTSANPHVEENTAWIQARAQETGGDISRLSKRDRALLEKITRGHGEMALSVYARR